MRLNGAAEDLSGSPRHGRPLAVEERVMAPVGFIAPKRGRRASPRCAHPHRGKNPEGGMRRERLMRVVGEFHAVENPGQAAEHWRGQTGLGDEAPERGGF